MTKRAPVEPKVLGATVGAPGGVVVAQFVVWLLGVLVWHQPDTADHATATYAAVPIYVIAILTLTITAAGTFIGGWLPPHAHREAG